MATAKFKLGWRRDLPDIRDYHSQHDDIQKLLSQSQPLKAAAKQLPAAVDLRAWCSPIEDQGDSGAQLRDTIKAMVLSGEPLEQYHSRFKLA